MMEWLSLAKVIYVLDMIGIVACATAGTILAMKKNFDFFGCILVSMVGSIGGGTVRDVILDRHPLFWTQDLSYVVVITITSLLVQIFINHSHKIDGMLKFFDAIGLAAFSVIGFNVANSLGAKPPIAVMMAVLTSIAGGIMRDMICHEIPLVLQKEIYISASIVGCVLYFVLDGIGVPTIVRDGTMLGSIFVIRMTAIKYDWHLPTLGGKF